MSTDEPKTPDRLSGQPVEVDEACGKPACTDLAANGASDAPDTRGAAERDGDGDDLNEDEFGVTKPDEGFESHAFDFLVNVFEGKYGPAYRIELILTKKRQDGSEFYPNTIDEFAQFIGARDVQLADMVIRKIISLFPYPKSREGDINRILHALRADRRRTTVELLMVVDFMILNFAKSEALARDFYFARIEGIEKVRAKNKIAAKLDAGGDGLAESQAVTPEDQADTDRSAVIMNPPDFELTSTVVLKIAAAERAHAAVIPRHEARKPKAKKRSQ